MAHLPESIAQFMSLQHIAVAGVSRDSRQPANAIYRKLRGAGFDTVPVNPNAATVEGAECFPDLAAIPGPIEGVVVATHPRKALELVRQCGRRGIRHVWFHRSIGSGSVSAEAVEEGRRLGLQCIVGGCPLMYCEPVDPFHRCMCAVLRWRGRVPR